jgi:RNA polymerase sigma-70 factor, ECF subfamily
MNDWNSIVRQHTPLVWGTAWRLLGNQADAADCYQETFLAALEASRREPVRNWPALLARIATTRAIDRLRRRLRRSESSGDDAGWDTLASLEAGPDQAAQHHELGAQLRRVLAELPEPQGTVFSLRFLDEWSYDQIAEELGMTTSAVGVMIHRTRGQLKQRLASLADQPNEVQP